MPVISEFYGMYITMYWSDHPPPHFHVRYSEFKATIDIERLQVLTGSLPRTAQKLVLEWASQHQTELMENWKQCELKAHPAAIAPLP